MLRAYLFDPRRQVIALLIAVVGMLGWQVFGALDLKLVWDSGEYAAVAHHVADGSGFVLQPGELMDPEATEPAVTRYPPGLGTLLAPFAAAGEVRVGGRVLTLAYLLALVWAAWTLGGPLAGLVAASFAGVSPFLVESAQIINADATGAALGLAVLALLGRTSRRSAVLIGALAALGLLVRMANFPVLVAALLVLGRRSGWGVLGATPFLSALGLFQWHYFGSPLRTGYAGTAADFDVSYIWDSTGAGEFPVQPGGLFHAHFSSPGELPNYLYYFQAIGEAGAFAPPLIGILGLLWMATRRRTPQVQFVALSLAGTFALFLPYYHQAIRLVAAPAAMLVVMAAALIALAWGHPALVATAGGDPADASPEQRGGRPAAVPEAADARHDGSSPGRGAG